MISMRIALGLLLVLAAPARCTDSLDIFVRTVVDQIEAGATDSEVARYVEHASLQNPLEEADIAWLKTVGSGPHTMKALQKLERRTANLPALTNPVVTQEPRPKANEVSQIVARTIAYVNHYTATLVDFTCSVVTKTYTKEPVESRPLPHSFMVIEGESTWQRKKTVTKEVSYYKGREYYEDGKSLASKKGQSLTPGASWSSGEFANTLKITFSTSSHAHFAWDHWEHSADKKLAVFSYSIDANYSRLAIGTQVFRAGTWRNTQIYAAYNGFFFADPESGAVYRLIVNTSSIPGNYAISRGNTVLDYGPVEIAGARYMLLLDARSYIRTKEYQARFYKSYTDYRKFQAESQLVVSGNSK